MSLHTLSVAALAAGLRRKEFSATELAREAVQGGADAVVTLGGDGTVNEAAAALAGTPTAALFLVFHVRLQNRLEIQTGFARSVSQGSNPTMIEESTTVIDDALDPGALGTLGGLGAMGKGPLAPKA